jgi:FkbM family methyltransferase
MKLKYLFIKPKDFFLNLIEKFFKLTGFEVTRYGQGKIVAHPWDFPELMLLEHLKLRKKNKLFIVGAHLGKEVPRLLDTGGVSKIFLFEPNPRVIKSLKVRMLRYRKYTQIIKAAVSNKNGSSIFYETNRDASSSMLKVSELAYKSYKIKVNDIYKVKTIKLDTFVMQTNHQPDVLWIDVQGAEMMVLEGAKNILRDVELIYLEISIWTPLYENGALMNEIEKLLNLYDFKLSQLGTDLLNGTGNAIYIKKTALKMAV